VYLADIFNSRGFFQYLGGWITTLGSGAMERAHIILQRAYQVNFHLEQGRHLEQAALSQFNAHAHSITGAPRCIQCWSPLVAGLIIELSETLGTLRVLQNEVWMLATAATGARNSPSSMRDAYKTIIRKYGSGSKRPKWTTEIPASVRNAVATYWEASGETIATYRDVDQHHDVLARGCFLIMEEKVIRRVSVRLPDNPESKSRVKFTYEKEIDGFNLAQAAFSEIHELVETLAKLGNASQAPLERRIDFVPAIEHEIGVARSTGLILFDLEGKNGFIIGQDEEMHVTLRQFAL
jgi:hypothetical protein